MWLRCSCRWPHVTPSLVVLQIYWRYTHREFCPHITFTALPPSSHIYTLIWPLYDDSELIVHEILATENLQTVHELLATGKSRRAENTRAREHFKAWAYPHSSYSVFLPPAGRNSANRCQETLHGTLEAVLCCTCTYPLDLRAQIQGLNTQRTNLLLHELTHTLCLLQCYHTHCKLKNECSRCFGNCAQPT